MDIWVIYLRAVVNSASMNMDIQIPFKSLLLILLVIYSKVEMLNYVVICV